MVESIRGCVELCLEKNQGQIFMSLSGGLDSTLFLAITRRLFPHIPIITFTITMDSGHPDFAFSEQATNAFGAEREFATINPRHNLAPLQIIEKEFEKVCPNGNYYGDLAVFALYKMVSQFQRSIISDKLPRCLIAHDGIDELHGGYWPHRSGKNPRAIEAAFNYFWERLGPDHLVPLCRSANHFGITPVFPYLQKRFGEYSVGIPLSARTSHDESKILIRQIARNFDVPEEIIDRPKIGFCDALKPSGVLERELVKRR
jgi:asparagine synthetase B (glutamine-hydrolysing)